MCVFASECPAASQNVCQKMDSAMHSSTRFHSVPPGQSMPMAPPYRQKSLTSATPVEQLSNLHTGAMVKHGQTLSQRQQLMEAGDVPHCNLQKDRAKLTDSLLSHSRYSHLDWIWSPMARRFPARTTELARGRKSNMINQQGKTENLEIHIKKRTR